MPAKAAVQEETVMLERPARTNREGRSDHLSVSDIGRMKLYTFKDVTDYAYTQGLSRFEVLPPQVVQTLDKSGKPQSTAMITAIAWFWERDPNTTEWVEKPHYGIGDANFENTGNANIGQHFIRMAETRAKGRALAHALNLDANFAEEMGDTSDNKPAPAQRSYSPPPQQSQPSRGFDYSKEDPSKFPPQNGEDGWYCEVTNQKLKDTAQSSAGRKAQWAMEKTGRILSYEEQQKALGNG